MRSPKEAKQEGPSIGAQNNCVVAKRMIFDHSPALVKAWRNLTDEQRNHITNQIMHLSHNFSIEESLEAISE